ncbi:MAG: hypothetical protein WCI75_15845, partial [candidate division NC10 bacterium]
IAGVALVSAYIAGNPAAYESAKLTPGEKLLYKETLPALPEWRGILTTGLPVAVQAGPGDLWSDDQLAARLGIEGRRRAQEELSWENYVSAFGRVIASVGRPLPTSPTT